MLDDGIKYVCLYVCVCVCVCMCVCVCVCVCVCDDDFHTSSPQSKMLEELDAQFGIGDLVEQEITEQKMKKYSRRDLTGLQVQHDMSRWVAGVKGKGNDVCSVCDT